jgi:hypothetical protein
MSDSKHGAADAGGGETPARFVGEEGEDTRSTPDKDLAAALVIGAVSLIAIYLAVAMPVLDSVLTAPGLLPFLVGLSLLAMSAGLGIRAIRNGATLRPSRMRTTASPSTEANIEKGRVAFLIGLVAVYVVAVDLVTFDIDIPTPFFRFSFSSYELVSAVVLTILLKMFWRATLPRCLLVSVVWVIVLASIFRDGFRILLPGSA